MSGRRLGVSPYTLFVEVKMNGTSSACLRVASSITSVPFAFTVKSMIGSLAAQSWDGCAAACTTSARSPPYFAKILLIASASRMSAFTCV